MNNFDTSKKVSVYFFCCRDAEPEVIRGLVWIKQLPGSRVSGDHWNPWRTSWNMTPSITKTHVDLFPSLSLQLHCLYCPAIEPLSLLDQDLGS